MRITPSALLNVTLATVLLSSMFLVSTTSRGSGNDVTNTNGYAATYLPYDPWADIDDNGKIDIKDLAYSAARYGAVGTPINKTALREFLDRIETAEFRYQIKQALRGIMYQHCPPLTYTQAEEMAEQGTEAIMKMLEW